MDVNWSMTQSTEFALAGKRANALPNGVQALHPQVLNNSDGQDPCWTLHGGLYSRWALRRFMIVSFAWKGACFPPRRSDAEPLLSWWARMVAKVVLNGSQS